MTWVLRGLFAAIVAAVVVAQAARIGRVAGPPDDASTLDQRLTALAPSVTLATESGVLSATFAGCQEAVAFAAIDADGLNSQAIQALLSPQVLPRYVYLGSVSDRIDPVVVAARWALASILAALGLYPDPVPREIVVVLVPKACHDAIDFNWSVLSPWRNWTTDPAAPPLTVRPSSL